MGTTKNYQDLVDEIADLQRRQDWLMRSLFALVNALREHEFRKDPDMETMLQKTITEIIEERNKV